ncbi:threonylcarbamoyl-AMP synthase [bacterium]|nr:threonylcarbamoyl-AMP synthase [bacterium]
MKRPTTIIYDVDKKNPQAAIIQRAAEIIKEGGLVAFPTETVYGLGADAYNPMAVKKVFEVKKRPLSNPLIVHIAEMKDLLKLGEDVGSDALALASKFWPGPLTLVVKRNLSLPDIVTSGGDTIAIRMPDNRIALSLIRTASTPIAAPSANRFGYPSPTQAIHVAADLVGQIDLILDGGPTELGIESTVVDLTLKPPLILRQGAVSLKKLKTIIPEAQVSSVLVTQSPARSPGLFLKHYAPEATMLIVEGEKNDSIERIKQLRQHYIREGNRVGILTVDRDNYSHGWSARRLYFREDSKERVVSNLFAQLRAFDEEGMDIILVEGFAGGHIEDVVLDRLRRAAGSNIVHVGKE